MSLLPRFLTSVIATRKASIDLRSLGNAALSAVSRAWEPSMVPRSVIRRPPWSIESWGWRRWKWWPDYLDLAVCLSWSVGSKLRDLECCPLAQLDFIGKILSPLILRQISQANNPNRMFTVKWWEKFTFNHGAIRSDETRSYSIMSNEIDLD